MRYLALKTLAELTRTRFHESVDQYIDEYEHLLDQRVRDSVCQRSLLPLRFSSLPFVFIQAEAVREFMANADLYEREIARMQEEEKGPPRTDVIRCDQSR